MSQPTFERLGLPGDLIAALAARRITEPFAIQTLTLPDSLGGRDILGRAPTGSGKTLAFGLPALSRLAGTDRAAKRRPRGLILSPTRELAEQIQRELDPLARSVGRRVSAVYGGAAIGPQIKALARGVDLLVATPGRLLDLLDQGEVALDQVELAVVDEADRMADMGFLPDVRKLLDQTADDRQTLLFSATLDNDVQELTDRYQHDPALHEIGDPEPDLSLVEHRFIKVKKPHRLGVAADLIAEAGGPTVVFVRTRHGVDRLARQLRQHGIKAGYIHGGRSQSQRTRALEVFTQGKVDTLVATDVAARGIHVDGVVCVLHYDPPAEIKDYVHRSGRTARAGAGGTVISLLDPVQVKSSEKMQRELGIDAELEPPPRRRPRPTPEPDDEPTPSGPSRSSGSSKPSRGRSAAGGQRKPSGSSRSSGSSKPSGGRSAAGGQRKPSGSSRSSGSSKPSGGRSAAGGQRKPSAGPSKPARSKVRSERRDRDESGGPARPRKPVAAGPETDGETGERPEPRKKGKPRPAAGGKARAKAGRRATKRSGRPRPPNRKGRKGAKAAKDKSPRGS